MNTIENALAKLQEISDELAECPDTAQLTDAIFLTAMIQQVIAAQNSGLTRMLAQMIQPVLKAETEKIINGINPN